jgi:hypothetical protein
MEQIQSSFGAFNSLEWIKAPSGLVSVQTYYDGSSLSIGTNVPVGDFETVDTILGRIFDVALNHFRQIPGNLKQDDSELVFVPAVTAALRAIGNNASNYGFVVTTIFVRYGMLPYSAYTVSCSS